MACFFSVKSSMNRVIAEKWIFSQSGTEGY